MQLVSLNIILKKHVKALSCENKYHIICTPVEDKLV